MSGPLRSCCDFLRSFAHVKRTPLNVFILILPFILIFITMQLLLINSNEEVGAIVSNAAACAEIGKDILVSGGSVIDAAISTMLCEGIHLPTRAGLGGGFTAVMYINGKFDTITATVRAPAKFSADFFNTKYLNPALAVGVPGELLGYWSMHQKYGHLPWRRIFEGPIKLCRDGIYHEDWERHGKNHLNFHDYENSSGEINNTLITLPELEKTLIKVAEQGADVFYKGDIGRLLVEDLRDQGGIMTEDDLRSYKVSWNSRPISVKLSRTLKLYTTPLPSAGAIVVLVMNIIKSLPLEDRRFFWHKVVEALEFGYANGNGLSDTDHETDNNRDFVQDLYNNMIDEDFAALLRDRITDYLTFNSADTPKGKREAHTKYMSSTANICVLSTNGDAIALSTSLLIKKGVFVTSSRTGIILNNEMENFRSSHTRHFIIPGKRPFSGHCPTIVVARATAEVRFIVGASGHETAPAQVIAALIDYCLLKLPTSKAANDWFFQPDVENGVVYYGIHPFDSSDEEIIGYLTKLGHIMVPVRMSNPHTARTCIGHSYLSSDAFFTHNEDGSTALIKPNSELNVLSIFTFVGVVIALVVFRCYEIIKLYK